MELHPIGLCCENQRNGKLLVSSTYSSKLSFSNKTWGTSLGVRKLLKEYVSFKKDSKHLSLKITLKESFHVFDFPNYIYVRYFLKNHYCSLLDIKKREKEQNVTLIAT